MRRAHPEDAPGLARVHVDTWRTTYPRIVPAQWLASLSYEAGQERWERYISEPEPGQFVLVAEHATEGIVGFVSAGPNRAAGVNRTAGPGPAAESSAAAEAFDSEIYALYILQAHQRRGIGRRLVGEAARELAGQGHKSAIVWVLADNPNRAFYAALGGREGGHQTQDIGGAALDEVAYVWQDVGVLLT